MAEGWEEAIREVRRSCHLSGKGSEERGEEKVSGRKTRVSRRGGDGR